MGTEGGKAVVTFSLILHFPAAAPDTFWRGGRWERLSWLEQVPSEAGFLWPLSIFKADSLWTLLWVGSIAYWLL